MNSVSSGIYFAEAEKLLSTETGPVRLESVQARLAQCIHLLASSRINQAWYTFGTATQMISALGLHRRSHPSSLNVIDSDSAGLRKRVFWSAYTLDRYLSVILGRPKLFHDEDIDPSLSGESSGLDGSSSSGTMFNQSVSEGPVFHAKYVDSQITNIPRLRKDRLARILGAISSELYATSRTSDGRWIDSARKWTIELKQWKESLPPFLNPAKVDPSMLVPIFQRQSTVLRLAYAHAMILANRPSLLSKFADLQRVQELASGESTGSLKECIDAALEVVVTVNTLIQAEQMRKAFWFTHYISFCAISAMYVYTIQRCLSQGGNTSPEPSNTTARYFDAAAKCQESIEKTTTTTSPFHRYNLILAELKKEVTYHLNAADQPITAPTTHSWRAAALINNSRQIANNETVASSAVTTTNRGQPFPPLPQQQDPDHQSQAQQFNPRDPSSFDDDACGPAFGDNLLLDLNAFGQQGELMGWSDFDSCVSLS